MTPTGLSLPVADHEIRLKWHRLRRRRSDPEFGLAVMREGFRLGASMELDLQVRGDGGFVVLHDADLARETRGRGPVAALDAGTLRGLRYAQQDCGLILSEDLAVMLPQAHPRALLQLDLKNDLAEVGKRGVAHLAEHFAEVADRIILSAGCARLIGALADRAPGLRRGIDPTDRLLALWPEGGLRSAEALLRFELGGGMRPDTVYLDWELVVMAARAGLDMVALARDLGVKVDAWTHHMAAPEAGFSDAEWTEFEALLALRPDQITTDDALATEAAWRLRAGTADW